MDKLVDFVGPFIKKGNSTNIPWSKCPLVGEFNRDATALKQKWQELLRGARKITDFARKATGEEPFFERSEEKQAEFFRQNRVGRSASPDAPALRRRARDVQRSCVPAGRQC